MLGSVGSKGSNFGSQNISGNTGSKKQTEKANDAQKAEKLAKNHSKEELESMLKQAESDGGPGKQGGQSDPPPVGAPGKAGGSGKAGGPERPKPEVIKKAIEMKQEKEGNVSDTSQISSDANGSDAGGSQIKAFATGVQGMLGQ